MKKAQTIISAIIVTGLLACAAFFVGVRVSGLTTFVVTGGSMEPTIPIGSLTVVQPVKAADLKLGDVVTFQHESENVTHRIVAIELSKEGELVFTTKGDANNAPDRDKITFAGPIGLVRYQIPVAGFVLAAAQSIWREALILLAAIIFFASAWQIIFGRDSAPRGAFGPTRRITTIAVRVSTEELWAQHVSWLQRANTRHRRAA
jgi:signal peptidase